MKLLSIKNISKNYQSKNEISAIKDLSIDVYKNYFIDIP